MRLFCSVLATSFVTAAALGQVGGGSAAFQQGRSKLEAARAVELAKRVLPEGEKGRFVEAAVLLNAEADRYIATFAISGQGKTLELAQKSADETVQAFLEGAKELGITQEALFVDFVSQNRLYAFQIEGNVAKEYVDGFEVKKNVVVRYREKSMLDRITHGAGQIGVFDLVKVDYIVDDLDGVRKKLMTEAARIIKSKLTDAETLLGIRAGKPQQVVTFATGTYFPTELYDGYVAEESEQVYNWSNLTVQRARKPRTFFWNGFDAKDYDSVLNPANVEPTVQFTLFLRVRC